MDNQKTTLRPTEPMIWNIRQASEATGIPVNTLYGWASRKKVPYVKINGKLMFVPVDVKNWINSQRVEPINAG